MAKSLENYTEMDEKTGISLVTIDHETNFTQKILEDGEAISFICESPDNKSSIKMTPDKVTINCDTFKIEADTITFNASESIKFTSEKEFNLSSKENLDLTSSAMININAAKVNVGPPKPIETPSEIKTTAPPEHKEIDAPVGLLNDSKAVSEDAHVDGVKGDSQKDEQKQSKKRAAAKALAAVQKAKQETTWIEFELYDNTNKLIKNEPYEIITPKGEIRNGTTDSNGIAKLDLLKPGMCRIKLVNRETEVWKLLE